MKALLKLGYCLPALVVALAAGVGFRTTEPVLESVVWPEKPIIEQQAQEAATGAAETELSAQEEPIPQPNEEETETPQGVGSFTDGVYTGTGTGYSGATTVSVKVEQGQITSIEVTAHKDKEPFFGRAKGVIDRMLRAQTWEVDAVSGATYSSRGLIEAVRNALTGSDERSRTPKKKKQPKKIKTKDFDDTQTLSDGVWTGSARGFGGKIKVRVRVKNGKMTSIDVISHSGESPSYFKKGKKIIDRILKKQTPNVDTISGATYSSKGIREAVKAALEKAAGKGKTKDEEQDEDETEKEKLPSGTPQDGTYTGKGKCEQFGYSVTLKAVFKGGKLQTLKDFKLVNNKNKDNEVYAKKAWKKLKSSLLKASGTTVDTVSGATYSSKAIVDAYRNAYDKAVKGDTSQSEEQEEKSEQEHLSGGTPQDGTYSGSGVCEQYGYTVTLKAVFLEGKLQTLKDFQLVNNQDRRNEAYAQSAWEELSETLPGALEKVDLVSGATYSSKAIVAAYQDAFAKAVKGEGKEQDSEAKQEDNTDADRSGQGGESGSDGSEQEGDSSQTEPIPSRKDGTYSVTVKCESDEWEDFEDYDLTVAFTFQNGVLTDVRITDASDKSNESYYNRALNGNSKIKGIAQQLKEKNAAEGVDTVSRATCSSKALISAFEQAVKQAEEAA